MTQPIMKQTYSPADKDLGDPHSHRSTADSSLSPGGAERLAWVARATAYSCFILGAAPFVYHLWHGSPAYLGLLEDDYFYYATVADNVVRAGHLSYDGVTPTNGFHPLWQLALTLLRFFCGRFGPAYYVGLTVIAVAAMIATYELSVRFGRILGLRRGVAEVLGAVFSLGTARLMTMGMEAVLGVPLLLWLLVAAASPAPLTAKRAARLGLIASLAILARLDVAIAVGLLLAAYLVFVRPPMTTAVRLLAAFGAGGVLLPLYLAANLWMFGTAFPVSALAKQLHTGLGFNLWYARTAALGTVYGPIVGVLLPLGAIAFALLWRRSRQCAPASMVGAIAVAFAFILWGINALSGWIFFGWYAFPVVPAGLAAGAFVWQQWGWLIAGRKVAAAALAILMLGLPTATAIRYFIQHGPEWSVSDNALLAAGYDLAPRMRDRPGVYAMGAIAGVVAYAMDHPMVQVEGIMADRRMVEHVRNQDALEDVLREYNVDYLIVSLASVRAVERDGCYEITQPHAQWAGPRTLKMRGEICSPPLERFITPAGTNPWSVFPAIETLVWNVRDARWKPRRQAALAADAADGPPR